MRTGDRQSPQRASGAAEARQPVELLAPAGGIEAALAAIQYGADSVYLGLKRFSARADADNFGLEDLDRLVGYAHGLPRRRRVFVALNTLVLQPELGEVARTLGAIADIGVDAVIVQDLGVVRLARRHFPELELHASTQLCVHDRAGVQALARLGFRRVTLARELTLEEVRECASVPGVEIETFLHGALCYAYSGLCLFSSLLLQRSGNRGTCAYPCRDRWRVERLRGGEGDEGLSEPQRRGFAFSMKDLALADFVPALREAGVACLKIEGRKKSPLYVAAAVDYYRRLLDGSMPASERPGREADLKAVFSRPWTSLYLRSHRDKDVADRDFVGHRGTRVGTVETVVRTGKVVSVRFTTSRALARHDGLQIDIPGLDRPFGFSVGDLKIVPASRRDKAESRVEVPAGTRVDVPLPDGYPTIPEGAPISCSSSQAVKARYRVQSVNLKAHRVKVGAIIEAVVGDDALVIRGVVPSHGIEVERRIDGTFDRANDKAAVAAAARGAFEKLGDTRLRLERLSFSNPDGRFVPVSRLNEARRDIASAIESKIRERLEGRIAAVEADGCSAPEPRGAAPRVEWSIKVDRVESLAGLEEEDWAALSEVVVDIRCVPLEGIAETIRALDARKPVRLALPLVTRAWESKALETKVARLREAGFTRWEAGNVSTWSWLGVDPVAPDPAMDLSTDWALHVLNRAAARQLFEMGARRVTLSPENGFDNLRDLLAELADRATVIVYQDTPLFLSESCAYANLGGRCPGPGKCDFEQMELVSSHGGRAIALNERCRTVVIHEVPFCLADEIPALMAAGAQHLRADFIHRPYSPVEVAAIFRKLRAGERIAGHHGNFSRGRKAISSMCSG